MESGIISDKALYEFCSGEIRLDIAGLFSRGVYLRADSGQVIVLHDRQYGMLPFGIALERGISADRQVERQKFHHAASISRYILRIPILDCEYQLVYEPGMIRTADPGEKARENLVSLITEKLKESGKSELLFYAEAWPGMPEKSQFTDIFIVAAYPGMSLLHDALLTENKKTGLQAASAKLIGLGRGLTPSVDDYLFAFLYSLRVLNLSPSDHIQATLSELFIQTADARTNLFSAAYLKAAASGGRFSLLDDCLFAEDLHSQKEAVERLADVGGSSGHDMLAGMLLALRLAGEHSCTSRSI